MESVLIVEKSKTKKKIIILLSLLAGLLVTLIIYFTLGYQRTGKKHILIIQPFEQSHKWVEEVERGINRCLKDNRIAAEIETIYLFDDIIDINQKAINIRQVLDGYTDKKPDLIFICDDDALQAFLLTKHPLSYTVPVVFTGVSYLPEKINEHTNITGLTTTPDYEKCYQLARQLFGLVEEVILIAEDSGIGKQALTQARTQFQQMPNLTEIYESYWSYYETDSLRSMRSVVNPLKLRIERVDMLPGYMLKNVLYYKLNSFCVLPAWHPSYAALPRMGTAPFLMVSDDGFGDGQIGGYMTQSYQKGYDGMTIGVKLLLGDNIESYPIKESIQVPVFEWEQLLFWKIDLDKLPEDSVILNMPLRVKYRLQIVTSSVIVFLFVALFAIMLLRLYRREYYNKNKAKENLKKEQKELDITIASLKEGLVSVSPEGIILSINKTAITLLGFDPKQSYIGESVWSLFNIQRKNNPYYLKEQLKELSQTLGSHVLSETAYIITKDNRTFSIEGSISSLYYSGISYGSVISFHDTTDEYAQKEYLALSMISGDIFACRYDQANKVILYNESFFSNFGINDNGSHSITRKDFIKAIHPEDRHRCLLLLLRVIRGKAEKVTLQMRMDLNGKGYQWWEYRVSIMPESTRDSRYLLIGICMSIDKFKKTEQDLIRLKDEAENSDLMKSAFLSNMSHEVRTPLNSIVGFSTLLIEGDELPKESRDEFMEIINENCKLLLKLINEILDLSRIESDIVFRKEPCDLNRMMEELLPFYISEGKGKEGVSCEMDLPGKNVILNSDVYRLKQVMSNLLDNAFKFTEEGTIFFGYKYDEEKDEAILFVKDSGVGIAEEYLPRIFDRFYKSDQFMQGGGLGLSIVAEIVKRMNGRINVKSKIGEGTSFFIHLPVHEKDEEPKKEELI